MKKYFLLFAILFSKEDKENILLILDKDLSKKDVEIYSYKTDDLRNQFYLYITFKENTILNIGISHERMIGFAYSRTSFNNEAYSRTSLNNEKLEQVLASRLFCTRQKIELQSIIDSAPKENKFNFNSHEIDDIKRYTRNCHYNILSIYGNFDEEKVKNIVSKHYNIIPEYSTPKEKSKSSIHHLKDCSQIIINLDYNEALTYNYNEVLVYKNILAVMLYQHFLQNTDIIPKPKESKFTFINENFEFLMKINQTGDANTIKQKIESLIATDEFLAALNLHIKQLIMKHDSRNSERSAENNLKKYLIYGKDAAQLKLTT